MSIWDLKTHSHRDTLPLTTKKATLPISVTPFGEHFLSNHDNQWWRNSSTDESRKYNHSVLSVVKLAICATNGMDPTVLYLTILNMLNLGSQEDPFLLCNWMRQQTTGFKALLLWIYLTFNPKRGAHCQEQWKYYGFDCKIIRKINIVTS